MTEKISDERLAELIAEEKRIAESRADEALEVEWAKDVLAALHELAEYRKRVSEALAIDRWPYRPYTMVGYELDQAEGYNDARREFRRALGVTDDE